MLLSIVKIYPPAGVEQSILEVLESMKGPVATLTDCIGCSVMVETGDGGAICYTEQWATREALDRHLRSPLYGRVLETMECSRVPPEVDFYEVIEVGGLELVERVRTPH